MSGLPVVLENFCRAFSPGPTDRPWVSEDVRRRAKGLIFAWREVSSPAGRDVKLNYVLINEQ